MHLMIKIPESFDLRKIVESLMEEMKRNNPNSGIDFEYIIRKGSPVDKSKELDDMLNQAKINGEKK